MPKHKLKLKTLVYSQAEINWDEVLPSPLTRDIKHDSQVMNVDAVIIWQPLLSAVSSLAGGIYLDMGSYRVPPINNTCTVAESGTGKTRGDNLVLTPLLEMQNNAQKQYLEQMQEYKRSLRRYKHSNDPETVEPIQPTLRQYIMDIATIPAVLKRAQEQDGQGILWALDKIASLFKSLNQLSKQDASGMQTLLKLWNGDNINVSRVSVTGGIDDRVFRQIFKNPEDNNGLQTRFLFATPKRKRMQYVEGNCKLSDRLPNLYSWLDRLEPAIVKIQLLRSTSQL